MFSVNHVEVLTLTFQQSVVHVIATKFLFLECVMMLSNVHRKQRNLKIVLNATVTKIRCRVVRNAILD